MLILQSFKYKIEKLIKLRNEHRLKVAFYVFYHIKLFCL